MKNVVIILVNWNRPYDTLECIQSLNLSDYPNFSIVVVDNGSSDNSLSILGKIDEKIILIKSSTNLGFTGGNNLGIKYAVEHDADYVLLLNNDTVIAPDALTRMLEVAESRQDIGIVTPKILSHSQRDIICAAGTKYSEITMISHVIGYAETDKGQFDHECDLTWASGCAMLIKKEVINRVGLLNDDYFAVNEDVDYSLCARKHGYFVRYVPSAIVWHKESVSSGGMDSPQYVYYQTRNLIIFQRRWAKNKYHFVLAQLIAMLFFVKRAMSLSLRGKWQSIMGILYGLYDGLTGRLGRQEYVRLAVGT